MCVTPLCMIIDVMVCSSEQLLLLVGQSAESRAHGEDAVDLQCVVQFEAFPVLVNLSATCHFQTMKYTAKRANKVT